MRRKSIIFIILIVSVILGIILTGIKFKGKTVKVKKKTIETKKLEKKKENKVKIEKSFEQKEKLEVTKEEPEVTKEEINLESLKSELENINVDGNKNVYVCDIDSGNEIYLSEEKMQAASLIKLFIAGAAYENYDKVKSYLGEEAFEANMSRMITVSDNNAANYITKAIGGGDEYIGMKKVTLFCKENGYNYTSMNRLLLANKDKGDNITCAVDVGRFLRECVDGKIPGSKKIIEYMKKQERRGKIPAGIPKEVVCANKTGELLDAEHDASIVYLDEKPYILCAMVDRTSNLLNSRKSISYISKTVYEYMLSAEDVQKEEGLIVIDPGHQKTANIGKEPIGPGAEEMKMKVSGGTRGVSSGLTEEELALMVAKKLRKKLERAGYKVVLTRETGKVDISNAERAMIANDLKADAFIRKCDF